MAIFTAVTMVLAVGMLSDTTSARLICSTREGPLSGTGDDQQSRVSCQANEQMTGCSSYLPGPGGHGTRDGEFIERSDSGEITCVGRNGAGGTGVRAYARCCAKCGMECGYVHAWRSDNGDDNRNEVRYLFNAETTYLTGCSAITAWKNLDGAFPKSDISRTLTDIIGNRCIAQNGHSGGGVGASAVYCTAKHLTCMAKWSAKSGGGRGQTATVSCDDNWVMTGCNSFTYYKWNDGAYISTNDECVATNGGNNQYVYAVAICCEDGE